MSNWINHVKKYAKEHNITYKNALKEAKKTYKGGTIKPDIDIVEKIHGTNKKSQNYYDCLKSDSEDCC